MPHHSTRATLARSVRVCGVGLHSGVRAEALLRPAKAGDGIVFRRIDQHGARVPALWHASQPAALHTLLVGPTGARVATVEHLMAALHGLGITDILIDIEHEELPILDGSALPWVEALHRAGRHDLNAEAPRFTIARTIDVQNGAAWARLRPHATPQQGLVLRCAIAFGDRAIGQQSLSMPLDKRHFHAIQDARTFCMGKDIDAMRAQGYALGGGTDCAVVFDDGAVRNPEGLRHPDEPVRHKTLDAIGDLYLAGGFLDGVFEANRPGHALTTALLRQAFATPNALVPARQALLEPA